MSVPSIAELRRACQKPPEFETVRYARWVIRHVSIYVTWLLIHTPITANQVTALQTVFGVCGTVLLMVGGHSWALFALILIQFGYILDCSDGEVARYRQRSSTAGVFLDAFNHAIVNPLIFLSATVYVFVSVNELWFLGLGFATALLATNPYNLAYRGTIYALLMKGFIPQYDLTQLTQSAQASASSWFEQSDERETKRYTFGSFLKGILEYPATMNVMGLLIILDLISPMPLWVFAVPMGAYATAYVCKDVGFAWNTVRSGKIDRTIARIRQETTERSIPPSTDG